MEEKASFSRPALLMEIAITAFGIYYSVLYFVLSIPRLLFPYEIEFFEGTTLDHALRIFQGKQLFVAPSIEIVNLQYQPLYYYAAASAMNIFGMNYFSGRFVSFISTIVCAIIILYLVRRVTRSWGFALLAPSLFFAAYGVTGYWYELARVDSLMLLFLLASILSLLFWKNRLMIIVSSFFLMLAFFSKQQMFFYFAPAVLWLFLVERRSAVIFAASSVVFLAAGVFLFTLGSGGWYYYFTFTLPAAMGAELHWEKVWGGVAGYLFTSYASGTLLIIFFWISVWQSWKEWLKSSIGLFSFFAITAAIQLAVHFAHAGSYKNVAMPLAALMAIIIPLVSYALLKRNETTKRYFVLAAILVQFGGLFYSFKSVPLVLITKNDYQAGKAFLAELRSIPGNVFFPQHGFFPLRTGKKTYGNQDAAEECHAAGDSVANRFWIEWEKAFTEQRFDAIIVDDGPYRAFDSIPGYTFAREVNLGPHPFVTRAADNKSIPRYLYLPKQ